MASRRKVAAVTGGARGIGREIVRGLAETGATVVIGDRDLDVAEQTARELGDLVSARPLDVTDPDSFTGFIDGVEAEHGSLDVLVNNAGVMWVGGFDTEPDSATSAML